MAAHQAAKRKRVHAEMLAMQREVSGAKRAAGLTYNVGKRDTQAEDGWRRQMAVYPRDTRNLTARVFGDPLPGRSALDMRRA